jgi:2-hydroxy-3-keto-5-methylthiopentenyl-1-phosphate phosphatase
MKKKIRNKYFSTFLLFKDYIMNILNTTEQSYEELTKLLSLKFRIIK